MAHHENHLKQAVFRETRKARFFARKKFFANPLTKNGISSIVSYTSNEPLNQGKGDEGLTGNFNDATSRYLQIAAMLEDDILRGVLLEQERVPSTNELARAYSINPATAAKKASTFWSRKEFCTKNGGSACLWPRAPMTRSSQSGRTHFMRRMSPAWCGKHGRWDPTKEELKAMIEQAQQWRRNKTWNRHYRPAIWSSDTAKKRCCTMCP